MEHKKKALHDTAVIRATLFQTFIGAVILAVGTGLIGSAITSDSSTMRWSLLAIGLLLLFVGLGAVFISAAAKIGGRRIFQGVLLIDREQKIPRNIPRYRFSYKMNEIVGGIKAENKALYKAWEQQKIFNSASDASSLAFTREAIEYFVLDVLSLHLSSYFVERGLSDPVLTSLSRNEIPSVLFTNRFVDYLSRPLEERETFMERAHPPGGPKGRIVYARGRDGAVFSEFELKLPKDSLLTREKDGSLTVRTARFKMNIMCVIEGYMTVLPTRFEELYLKDSSRKLRPLKCGIVIDVDVKKTRLLSKRGLFYHNWIDGFLDRIDSQFSLDRFLSDIGYETALTTYLLSGPSIRLTKAPKSSEGEVVPQVQDVDIG